MNIYQKINKVMKVVSYIKKDASISGGGANYKAVTRDQVISLVREHIVEVGIVVQVSQTKGEWITLRNMNAEPNPIKMGLYSGFYTVRFVNIDDPKDFAEVCFDAHANDNGDKAPGKAATYAEKTAIIKMFSLETGINDEERPEEIVNQDLIDQFQYLIESKDIVGFHDFMAQFPGDSPIRNALFASAPTGKKTKYKDTALELWADAEKHFDEMAFHIEEAVEKDDEFKVRETIDEMSQIHKKKIWFRLNDNSKEYLTNLKGEK